MIFNTFIEFLVKYSSNSWAYFWAICLRDRTMKIEKKNPIEFWRFNSIALQTMLNCSDLDKKHIGSFCQILLIKTSGLKSPIVQFSLDLKVLRDLLKAMWWCREIVRKWPLWMKVTSSRDSQLRLSSNEKPTCHFLLCTPLSRIARVHSGQVI